MQESMAEAFNQTNFGAVDWLIVGVYLMISVAIGLWVKRYVSDMATYIGAGRKVGTWLGVATMTGTELGLVTVMYMAQKGFSGGFAGFHLALIAGVVTLFIGLTGFIVAPLRRAQVLTIPEFYEKRFSRPVRVVGGVLLAFAGILNMGLFLQVGSKFIVGITGLPIDGSALKWVMLTLLVLVLVYTTLGGMISVVLTDYVQYVVLSFGLVVATGMAIAKLGWENIFSVVSAEMGDAGFNPIAEGSEFGPYYVVWMIITAGLVGSAVWPTAVARALAAESESSLKRQYQWSSVSFMMRFILPMFWGICAFVFIKATAGGEDLKALFFPTGDGVEPIDDLYALPVFMGRLLPTVLVGIIAAAMIAAFMSTHDSYLLCWSSVITQDIVAPLMGGEMSTRARVNLTRVIIVLIGGFLFYWGLFYKGRQDVWDYMAVTGGIFFTGAFVVLVLGIYWKKASSKGAMLGLLSGFLMLFGLDPVQRMTGLKYDDAVTGELVVRLSSAQVGLLVVALAFVLMMVGSLIFPDREIAVDSTPTGGVPS